MPFGWKSKLNWGWFLSLKLVMRAGENFEPDHHFVLEAIFWKHAFDCKFDGAGWMFGHEFAEGCVFVATFVT